MDKIAGGFLNSFKEIDKLVSDGEISPALGRIWKEELVASYDFKAFSPAKAVAIAKKLDPRTLIDGFKPENDTRTALQSIVEFADKIDLAAQAVYGRKEWRDEGTDGRDYMKNCILYVLFEKTLGLKEALFSRREEMAQNYDQMLTTYKATATGGAARHPRTRPQPGQHPFRRQPVRLSRRERDSREMKPEQVSVKTTLELTVN